MAKLTNIPSNAPTNSPTPTATPITKIIYNSVILSGIQLAIASIELESKVTIYSLQSSDHLQFAADNLKDYIIIGLLWTIAVVAVFHSSIFEVFLSIFLNLLIMGWIIINYAKILKQSATKNHLKHPTLFWLKL